MAKAFTTNWHSLRHQFTPLLGSSDVEVFHIKISHCCFESYPEYEQIRIARKERIGIQHKHLLQLRQKAMARGKYIEVLVTVSNVVQYISIDYVNDYSTSCKYQN